MRLKTLLEAIGIRGRPRHYSYDVKELDLGRGVVVQYAQWLHPRESEKTITPDTVYGYRKILSEGDVCLDIGAHTGDSTLPMGLAVGVTGCVVALEPNPFVYHVLEKNARANAHATNIRTMMAAAAGKSGFMRFEYSDSGYCNGGRHQGIPLLKHGHAYKMDVFCVDLEAELRKDFSNLLPRLKFIKVDTEGYDLFVLRSMKELIEEYRPVVKAEMFDHSDQQSRVELLSFFEERDYMVHRIIAEPLETGPRLTKHTVGEWRHYDILCRAR